MFDLFYYPSFNLNLLPSLLDRLLFNISNVNNVNVNNRVLYAAAQGQV